MAVAVLIEMAEPDRASVDAAALVEACSGGSAEGPCALTRPNGPAPTLTDAAGPALAVVAWSEDHLAVRIEVGVRVADRPVWYARRLAFRPEDAERERWRSAGLVIASLAGDARVGAAGEPVAGPTRADARSEPVPPAAPPGAPRPAAPPAAIAGGPPKARSSPPLAIDALFLAGPALDDGSFRVGGGARVALRVVSPVYVTLGGRVATRPAGAAGVGVTWVSGSVGLGAGVAPWAALALEGRAELGVSTLHASIASPGGADSGTRSAGLGLVTADAAWRLDPRFGAIAGADLVLVPGATELRVGGKAVGLEPAATVTLHLGARWWP